MRTTHLLGLAGATSGTLLAGVVGLAVLVAADSTVPPRTGGWGLTGIGSHVPEDFLPWVLRAGALCPEFPPAVIAAQIHVESHWDPRATSPAGARGPAQFMPATWRRWGRDDDHDGTVSPWDVGDAVMAQGRYDCALAEQVRSLGGDVTGLALAAYNAGPGAVLRHGRVPPFPETQAYVPRVLGLATHYAATAPLWRPGRS